MSDWHNTIQQGDCLQVMKTLADNSIDSCVTDPPYGISFMNKKWDYQIPSVEIWEEVLRVLKPGGHLLCACGTRTQHRMTVNIEDAGFEIRDVITWHYGSGFPKSLDISKAIDKAAGVEREIIGLNPNKRPNAPQNQKDADRTAWQDRGTANITSPSTDAAKQWDGWGTALKPATEFWTLARKPIEENTIAENVLKYGTGGLNIDGSRIASGDSLARGEVKGAGTFADANVEQGARPETSKWKGNMYDSNINDEKGGRFPANVIFDEFTGKILDGQSGESVIGGAQKGSIINNNGSALFGNGREIAMKSTAINEIQGGASRFFYCPKADSFERNKGLKGFDEKSKPSGGHGNNENDPISIAMGSLRKSQNNHPTVKPIDLMRYLVKLITPKKGICIDPFCGSGTTLIGCKLELINYIGVELNEEYCKIAEARVAAWNPDKYLPQTLF